jgi:predicted TIM-barrel fold metal-dependent hydrolase
MIRLFTKEGSSVPLQEHMKLISTDDHVIEHPRVWTDRLPRADLERGPRVVEMSRPGQPPAESWLYEDVLYPNMALNAVAGKPREEFGTDPTRFDEVRPGAYDPTARVTDMDTDGVQAQLCFPTFPKFCGTVFLRSKDRELGLRCVQAWNDFSIDEWCAAAPDRLIPLMLLPLWDASASVAEIERCASKGVKAISFPESPAALGLPSFHTDHWDAVFGTAQDAGLPLCMHFGSSGRPPETSPDAPKTVSISLYGVNSMAATADLLFSNVFYKFKGLKVALSEGGIGWVPYLLERIDYTWERHRFYTGINIDQRPSELFRRHFWGCYIDDVFGLKNRYDVGVDRITWECDYPHSDSQFPHSRKHAAEVLLDVPDDEVHRIVEHNARELLGFTADLDGARGRSSIQA